MFEFLFIVLISYLFYNLGTRYVLVSRLMESPKAEHIAYALFMLSGTCLGNLLTLSLTNYYASDLAQVQIFIGTLLSILAGELFYLYNRRSASRIPSIQQRKNY